MEKNITDIYTKLSGGKQITSEEYTISKGDFNSIMMDRFKAELLKIGIKWNGEDIQYKTLINSDIPLAGTTKINGFEKPLEVIKESNPVQGFSVGIDIQNLSELPESNDYWEDVFYKEKFRAEEIAYCVKKENPIESFAGIYAAKEALIKCNNSLNWNDVLILYNENGKPFYNNYFLSISHSSNTAIAIALQNNVSLYSANNSAKQKISETVPLPHDVVDAPQKKSYHKLYFLAILLIAAYLIVRDFILRH